MAVLVVVLASASLTGAHAQTFSLLYEFQGKGDGLLPNGLLARDPAGNLYGVTEYSEPSTPRPTSQVGEVYRLDRSGRLTVLHRFGAHRDGLDPNGLVRTLSGDLYGTTLFGGIGTYGTNGTVFKVSETGRETVLYRFKGPPDSFWPSGPVIVDGAGNVYGTSEGGKSDCTNGAVCGTVFMVNQSGKETIVHYFTGAPDGWSPLWGVTRDATGALYGTTFYGGLTTCPLSSNGCGVVFKIIPGGGGKWRETVLHRFTGGPDGKNPDSNVTLDAKGTLYGTAFEGGAGVGCGGRGCGTLYQISKAGVFKVLYHFTGGADGGAPDGNLVLDGQGNLYGTAATGGNYGLGTLFKVDPSGRLTVLHNFDGNRGAVPSGLVRDPLGNLYGITDFGGSHDYGTIYELTP
jgi:uncharacterized repeat protein (TIGR03803 family)